MHDESMLSPVERPRATRPWWVPPFLGRVPIGIDEKHLSLIGIIALAGFFESYDLSMLSAALKQIRESFGLGQMEMTSLVAYVRLGAIPGFLILPIADRIGRRRVFLWALGGLSIGTFLTAFTESPMEFVALQAVTRIFVVACVASGIVIIAEELPAEHRGWGIGVLGAIGSLGYGLGALIYAFVDVLPFGWRALYAVGLVPLFFIPRLARQLPETARFQAMAESGEGVASGWMAPIFEMVRAYPGRTLGIGVMALFITAGFGPAFGLLSDFLQTSRGWSPGSYSLMTLVAGMFGIVGNSVMGWAADRFGRRPVSFATFGLFPIIVYLLFLGPKSYIALVWVPMVFLLTGGNVLMRMWTTELFPTAIRNTAMGFETLVEALGISMGFVLVGMLENWDIELASAIVISSALTVVGGLVIGFFPETAGLELEATSAESSPPSLLILDPDPEAR